MENIITYKRFMKIFLVIIIAFLGIKSIEAQSVKILFDATKGEQAGNADWIIDADLNNVCVGNSGYYMNTSCNESNPQKTPTPAQSGITSSTSESYWKGAISAYAVECAKLGYIVESLTYTGRITYNDNTNLQDLSKYNIYVVCEPNIIFTTAEKTAIMQFVNNGGRLMMVADHVVSDRNGDGNESINIWNDLMLNNSVNSNYPFGFKFDSVDISQTTSNYTPNSLDSILNSSNYGSCSLMKISNGTTMTLYPSINSTVKGSFYKTGVNKTTTGTLVASSRFGKGKIVAFTDSSPFDDGTGDANDVLYDGWIADASGNHKKIIMNATIWLATLDSFKVNISPSGATTFCKGDSVTLTATLGSTYSWSTGETTRAINVKSSGTYSVTVTNSLGQVQSSSILIKTNPNPTPVVSLSGTTISTTNNYLSYQWYNNNVLISGATLFQYTLSQSGQYTVMVTDSNNCKGISTAYNYIAPTTFSIAISPKNKSICDGDSLTFTVVGNAVSYKWSSGETTSTIQAKTAKLYKVTATNSTNQTATDSVFLKVNPNPVPVLSQVSSTIKTALNYKKYWWYQNNSEIDSSTTSNIYTPILNSAKYKVLVIDSNGCRGLSNEIVFNKLALNEVNSDYNITYFNHVLEVNTTKNNEYKIVIYDLNGKLIYQSVEKSNIKWTLESIATPFFIVGIAMDGEELKWNKFLY